MNKRLPLVLLGLLLGVWLLAACGPATPAPAVNTPSAATAPAAVVPPKKGGTLVVGLASEPPTMDPHASPSAITFYITNSTTEALLFLTEDRKLQPWLATS